MYGQGNLFWSTCRLRAELKVHPGCGGTACRTGTWRGVADESAESSSERYIRRSRAGDQYTRSEELRAFDSEFQSREDGHGKYHLNRNFIGLIEGYRFIGGIKTRTWYAIKRTTSLERLLIHTPRYQRSARIHWTIDECNHPAENDTNRCRLVSGAMVPRGNVR